MRSPLGSLLAGPAICGCLWAVAERPLAAEDARTILIEAENRHRTEAQEHLADITVTARSGRERHMIAQSYSQGYARSANHLIRFLSPPDIRGVGYLVLSRPGRPPNRWMYLPSMRRERRVAPQEQGSSFVGTDFSYEDLQEQIDQSKYDVSQLRDETLDGEPCYVFELVPLERSSYGKKIAWLRKDTLSLVRTEFFKTPPGAPSKRLEFADFDRIDGYWIARRMMMADLQKGSRTTILLKNIALNRQQPPDRFTIQNLVRETVETASATDASPRLPRPRLGTPPQRGCRAGDPGMAAGAGSFSLALGPHPQRELTPMLRLGSARPRLGMAAGAGLSSYGAGGPPPARTDADASPRLPRPRLGMAAGADLPSYGAGAPGRSPAPATFGAGFTGFVEALGVGFIGRANDRDSRASGWATVFVKQTATLGRVRLSGSFRAQAITWPVQAPIAFDPAERRLERTPLSLRELAVVAPLAPAIDLEVGLFDTAWSWTDGYSPADAFMPRDVTDPLADERLPLWGARLRGDRGPFRFEIYSSFVTTPWRLPPMDGRYSPFAGARVYPLKATEPPPIRGFQMARVLHSGGRWDVGGWVRAGVRPAPIVFTTEDVVLPVQTDRFVATSRRFTDEQAAGVELSREVNGWMLRGEAAVFRSNDPSLGNAVIVSAEAERFMRAGALTFSFAQNAQATPVDPIFLFDRAYLPVFVVGTTQLETWGSWEVRWLGTFRRVGGVLKAEIAKRINDATRLTVGTSLPYGTSVDSPGAFRDARQARASIRWSW